RAPENLQQSPVGLRRQGMAGGFDPAPLLEQRPSPRSPMNPPVPPRARSVLAGARAILALCGLCVARVAGADDGMTLSDAIRAALATHPVGVAADARVDQARAGRSERLSALGPSMGATGAYTRRTRE